MCKAVRIWVLLASIMVIGAFDIVRAARPRTPATSSVKNITMYFIRLDKFTRLPTDSSSISNYNELELRIKRPKDFLRKFSKIVGNRASNENIEFGYDFVRLKYSILYQNGRTESILVDANKHVLWRKNLFSDSELLSVLISPIGRKQIKNLLAAKHK